MTADNGESVSSLLQRARTGDRQALDRLFAVCRNYMNIVARTQVESWLQAKFDPSDLVQQTLLEAYRGFEGFEGGTEAEWLVWLRRILTRNAVDLARHYGATEKRRVSREASLGTPGQDSAPGVPEPMDCQDSPSKLLLSKERELFLADALTRLDDDYREVILLRNLQGLPFDEVAQRMQRSRPAVQMLWMRAIRKLQELLGSTES